jgi:FAD/FMN-containing dehydrogenase
MGPIPYSTLNTLIDGAFPKGALNYWKASFLTDLTDEAIAVLIDRFNACPSPMSSIVIEHFHGAASRVPVDQTACAMRLSGFNVAIISQWLDPAESDRNMAWARDTYTALTPHLRSVRYVNYLATDESGDAATAAAYGANYPRLQTLKAKYDPDNFFKGNVNIRPR